MIDSFCVFRRPRWPRICRLSLIPLLLLWAAHEDLSAQDVVAVDANAQAAAPAQSTSGPIPVEPTPAEQSGFTATATGLEVETFLRRLASRWEGSDLTTIGRTVEGRPIWGLVVNPRAPGDTKPVTVLMLGGIHSGECDGKEALLALARDMSLATQDLWWQNLRLIFVPNFNADGNERRGQLHRPGQVGPTAGMGIRENAQGLDLNRDFIKLESPEVRSLVAALNEYDVDVLIDTHTTNGSQHRYQLTYDIPHNPVTPQSVNDWLREQLLPAVTERMRQRGFDTFYYGNFDASYQRWETFGHEPRFSTEYMGLRGRVGILAESYSYASYETRVQASYAFVQETLRGIAAHRDALRHIIDEAVGQRTRRLPIQAELSITASDVTVKGYLAVDGSHPQKPFGSQSAEDYHPKDFELQLWNQAVATAQVELPAAYVLPQQYAWAASRLIRHGVRVQQTVEDVSCDAEVSRITAVRPAAVLQGHSLLEIETQRRHTGLEIKRGDFVVATDQPLGELAAYLLEASADDSLARWNFFDPDIAADKDYPVARLPGPLDPGLLQDISNVPATEKLSLERLMRPGKTIDYDLQPSAAVRWLKNKAEYVVQQNGSLFAVAAASGARRPLTELNELKNKLAALDAFSDKEAERAAQLDVLSDDWRHAIVSHNNDLYYFDAQASVVRQLTHSPELEERLPELNPSGSHVAFVRNNNLWVVDCETTESKQLTQSGSPELLNGILDWVYQEELYGRGNFKAFWWSPTGQEIAYLQLDQSPVQHYQVSDSISYRQGLEDTRYPKAGDPLPAVDVYVINVASSEQRQIDLSRFPNDDRLLARVAWSPTGELWLQVLNRVQNKQDLLRVDIQTGSATNVLSETSPGWIEIRGTPEFLPDGDFLWLSDLPSGRTHLFRFEAATGKLRQLTRGDWDVDSLLQLSTDQRTAFVTGNVSHPTENQLVAVDVQQGQWQQITSAPGSNRFQVDDSGQYFLDTFSSIDTPPAITLHSIDGQMIRVVDAPTSDRYEYLGIRPPQLFSITARDGTQLQAALMLPADFEMAAPAASEDSSTESETQDVIQGKISEEISQASSEDSRQPRKLPVLFYVYAGPQAPTVKNAWAGRNYWWHQLLCQHGFAVVLCDNRAALGRGVGDTWKIRGDLGRVELQDLEDAVQWVAKQPWADSDRIGIWGWSYGGYFTSYAMTHSQWFRAGIAGAPVTDWRNYDAIYTERYMDLPQSNADGYESSSVVAAADQLHGRLLIVHGERDDNVHLSNSLQLVYALQRAGKQFDMMIYPKNRHGITDPEQKYHLYRLMTNFLLEHLME